MFGVSKSLSFSQEASDLDVSSVAQGNWDT